MKKITVYGNNYRIGEFFQTGISYIFSKLFWKNVRLICYPIFMRGRRNIYYGKGFSTGYNCRFDLLVNNKVTLTIGENCDLGDYAHISAMNNIYIGDNFLCGNFVYIGDNSHGLYKCFGDEKQSDPKISPKERPIYADSIYVGNNVWVGEHCSILSGAHIGNGCIIGANSVVNSIIPENSIAVGTPAKVVKKWNEAKKVWEKVI